MLQAAMQACQALKPRACCPSHGRQPSIPKHLASQCSNLAGDGQAAQPLDLENIKVGELKVRKAEYISSSVKPEQCPPPTMPEVAVIGRSNVGKSSLINMLTGRRDLALVSKTPGENQSRNVTVLLVQGTDIKHGVRVLRLIAVLVVLSVEHKPGAEVVPERAKS